MVTRIGFVSNSSSTSFVAAFTHKPKSVQDLKEMMFGKQEWHFTGIFGGENHGTDVSTQKIAEIVFADIKREATKKQIYESIRNGWFYSYMIPEIFPGIYDNGDETADLRYPEDKEEIERLYKIADQINDKRAKAIAEAFSDHNEDKYIVVLQYWDDEGEWGSILEHTNIFQRLDNIGTRYH